MITDPHHAQLRLARSLLAIARYLWYSPAIFIAVVRVLS